MFTATNGSGEEVCILDCADVQRDLLREHSGAGEFSCPVCWSAVTARLGTEVTWHFAHMPSMRFDCPLKSVPRAALIAIAVLYRWLKTKPMIQETRMHYLLPRWEATEPADLYFRTPKREYIYRMIAKRPRSSSWNQLLKLASSCTLNFVHLQENVQWTGYRYKLSQCQRDSIAFTANRVHSTGGNTRMGSTLGYLLAVSSVNRNVLKLTNPRHVGRAAGDYHADAETILLGDAMIRPSNGEIVSGSRAY